MTAPLCHYCASAPMVERFRIHVAQGNFFVVCYQCESCKRVCGQQEPTQ